MEIKYLGHSSFLLRGSSAKVITDPYSPSIGMRYPKNEADIVTISHAHPDHNYLSGVTGSPLVIDWPGEFEKNGVRIFGYSTWHDKKNGAERGPNIMYKFEIDGVHILHCGDLGMIPADSFIDAMGSIDVLLVPVGGVYTIDAKEAASLVKKVDPNIIIPMHYGHKLLDEKMFGTLEPMETFLDAMGASKVQPIDKLVVKAGELPEETKVVVMDMGK